MGKMRPPEPGPFEGHPDGYCPAARGVVSGGHLTARGTTRRALALLTNPAATAEQRAEAFTCLDTVAAAQIETDRPGDRRGRRGTWFWLGAGATGFRPDLNFADFIGNDLLELLRNDTVPDHADWPAGLLDLVTEGLRRAVDCSMRRRVRVSYTNPMAMSVTMCARTGERLGVPEYVEFARERLDEWTAFTDRAGGFEEFNSNTYAGVTLLHTATLAELAKDDDIREKALYMERQYLDHVIEFYHRPTGETCMPRSRAYHDHFAGTLLHGYLCRAVARLRPAAVFDPAWEPKPSHLPVYCHATEEQLDRLLTSPSDPRQVRRFVEWIGQDHVGPLDQAPDAGGDGTRRREITAYLHPEFCIGSVSEIDSWSQRRALGGYVRTDRGAAMVSWRPEIEVAGCESGELDRLWPAQMLFNLCTGQVGSTVLAGVSTMPVDGGWLCGSHWRQKVSGAIDGVTIDLGFDIEGAVRDDPPEAGVPWEVELGACAFTLLFIGGTDAAPAVRRTETGVRVTLLRRDDVTVDWSDPPRPGLAFVAGLAPRGEGPNLGAASWEVDGTRFRCSAEADGRRLRLVYDPPGIDDLTSRACFFIAD